jgi:hypothetical protein
VCGTWTLTLRAESRLRDFENTVLRKIFVCMRDDETEEWLILNVEELYDLQF